MPNVRIETREGWLNGRQPQLIDAVHKAMIEALGTPERDKDISVFELPEHSFSVPPHAGPEYLRMEIVLFSGRSLDTKRALYKALVDHLAPLGVAAKDTKFFLVEVPKENWGLRGGIAGCDIHYDFKVEK